MHKPKVVIPDDFPPIMAPSQAYQELLARAEVSYYDSLPSSPQELIDRIRDAEIIINIRSSISFTREVLSQCPRLRVLSIWGTGTNHIDLAAAREQRITVTNTPGVSAISMAEHTLALMLAAARNIPRIDAQVKQGQWPRGFVTQLHGKTLGILGLGAIGRQVARISRGIGMRVIAWTMHPSKELVGELGLELVDLEQLYRDSDVVSVHLRQSPETMGFLGEREFALMKPSALLVNTARGPIVDEGALIRALETDRIAGAGLDVFDEEPLPPGHPLTRLGNVVLTPHSGGVTPEALEAGLQLSVHNVFNFLAGSSSHVVVGPDA